jgi:hypothetical protein
VSTGLQWAMDGLRYEYPRYLHEGRVCLGLGLAGCFRCCVDRMVCLFYIDRASVLTSISAVSYVSCHQIDRIDASDPVLLHQRLRQWMIVACDNDD